MTRLWAAAAVFCGVASASLLPMVKMDPQAVAAWQSYADSYDKGAGAEFAQAGKLWIDGQSRARLDDCRNGKAVIEIIGDRAVPGGQLHHVVGAVWVPAATIESVHRQLQNYAGYQTMYRPDVVKSSGELLPGSTPDRQRYKVSLRLLQSTLWIEAGFEGEYASTFVKFDAKRSETHSQSTSIREYKDPHDPSQGLFPEGEDHGFLWRTATWWRARERDGGVDLELTSISLTKPVPTGAGWWASRKSRQTVEHLLNQTRAAIQAGN